MTDVVPFDRGTDSEMVYVSGEDDVLVAQSRVGAFELSNNIRTLDYALGRDRMNARGRGKREALRLARFSCGKGFVQALGRAREQRFCRFLVQQHIAFYLREEVMWHSGLLEPVHLAHLDLRDDPIPGVTLPVFGKHDGDDADRSVRHRILRFYDAVGVVRTLGGRKGGRCSIDRCNDLALDVDSGVVVIFLVRSGDAEPDEDD